MRDTRSSPRPRPATVRVEVRLAVPLLEDVDRGASTAGVSRASFVSAALSHYVSRGLDPRGERELVALRCTGSPWQHMEYILARHVKVEDLCDASHKLQPELKRALRKKLTPSMARRYEMVLMGLSYQEVARQEGCIKQAVGQSVANANRRLAKDPEFRALLERLAKRQLPEEFTVERRTP